MFECFKKNKVTPTTGLADQLKDSLELNQLHLAIIPGHNAHSQGATMSGHKSNIGEYAYGKLLGFEIIEVCAINEIKCTMIERDGNPGEIPRAYKHALQQDPSLIIELHFNAYDGNVRGCEALVHMSDRKVDSLEQAFGKSLMRKLSQTLDTPLRGDSGLKYISMSGERGFYNVSRATEIPSILLEPGFGDNKSDASALMEYRTDIAVDIVETCLEFETALIQNQISR